MVHSDQTKKYGGILLRITAILLVCAVAGGATWAWLARERSVVAVARVDSPYSILIKAGSNDDAKYLDLTGIDLNKGKKVNPDVPDDPWRYEEFIFSVAGDLVGKFRLQLAYTTNNQFTYEIYPAERCNNVNEADKVYTSSTGAEFGYRKTSSMDDGLDTGGKLWLQPLNLKDNTGSYVLGNSDTNDTYYTDTYGSYTAVNPYAVPLYQQTPEGKDIIVKMPRDHDPYGEDSYSFVRYFLLRVIWNSNIRDENDKETDMLYIAAKRTG